MIKIKIPFKTPSVNNIYGKTFKHKSLYLKKEGKELKEEINNLVQKDTPCLYDLEGAKISVTTEIHENWYTQKGTVKKKDIANREKFLIDSVFEALGLEDSFIFEHTMKKIQSDKEFSIIKIEVLEDVI